MKLVLSRKGFDAVAGGVPSPILPSGELVSLPIPEPRRTERSPRYDDLPCGPYPMGKVIRDLVSSGKLPKVHAHLDPDLGLTSRQRRRGWRPMFGQALAAEQHLRNEGVGAGDLVLFFGWFRQTEEHGGRLRYMRRAPDLHLLFGWLQIDRRCPWPESHRLPVWARDHPHCRDKPYSAIDSIYLATPSLAVPGIAQHHAGGGTFRPFTPARQLTAAGRSRSVWSLPRWFHPGENGCRLTYHSRPECWQLDDQKVLLRIVGRGQEFVLHNAPRHCLSQWLSDVFA